MLTNPLTPHHSLPSLPLPTPPLLFACPCLLFAPFPSPHSPFPYLLTFTSLYLPIPFFSSSPLLLLRSRPLIPPFPPLLLSSCPFLLFTSHSPNFVPIPSPSVPHRTHSFPFLSTLCFPRPLPPSHTFPDTLSSDPSSLPSHCTHSCSTSYTVTASHAPQPLSYLVL